MEMSIAVSPCIQAHSPHIQTCDSTTAVLDMLGLKRTGVKLGEGTYSTVFEVVSGSTAHQPPFIAPGKYAAKVLVKNCIDKFVLERFLPREIHCLSVVRRFENVARTLKVVETDTRVYFLMEKADTNLFDYVRTYVNQLSEAMVAGILEEVAHGVAYLHSLGIAHRDLKCDNILLFKRDVNVGRLEPMVKISDFGFAMCYVHPGQRTATVCGSKAYTAPEVWYEGKEENSGETYEPMCADMWSVGVIAYVMTYYSLPFPEGKKRLDYEPPPLPTTSSGGLQGIMALLFKPPHTRITATQLVEHQWLKQTHKLPLTFM